MIRQLVIFLLLVIVNISCIGTAYSESSIGAEILDKEEIRARELQDIEYQTKLLEKKTKLARMYQELQAHGGFVPDLEFMRKQEKQAEPDSVVAPAAGVMVKTNNNLPILKRIEGRNAYFQTGSGMVVAKTGSVLPGGYRVIRVDMESGVELEKSGVVYQTDVSWQP